MSSGYHLGQHRSRILPSTQKGLLDSRCLVQVQPERCGKWSWRRPTRCVKSQTQIWQHHFCSNFLVSRPEVTSSKPRKRGPAGQLWAWLHFHFFGRRKTGFYWDSSSLHHTYLSEGGVCASSGSATFTGGNRFQMYQSSDQGVLILPEAVSENVTEMDK